MLRIAAAQYPATWLADWRDYADKVSRWVAEAAWSGAQLLVFPVEPADLTRETGGAHAETAEAQQFLQRFLSLFQDLARRHGVHVLAPSLLSTGREGPACRSHVITPKGAIGVQESLTTPPAGHHEVRVFETAIGGIGVIVGHDIEFPPIARSQAEAGARLILVPSCTGSMAAYHRIRIAAQARALENGCCVVQAATIGAVPWSASLAVNVGAAAVFVRPGAGMPDDGVLAMGALNEPQWLFAELAGHALARKSAPGDVAAWSDQPALAVQVIRLQ